MTTRSGHLRPGKLRNFPFSHELTGVGKVDCNEKGQRLFQFVSVPLLRLRQPPRSSVPTANTVSPATVVPLRGKEGSGTEDPEVEPNIKLNKTEVGHRLNTVMGGCGGDGGTTRPLTRVWTHNLQPRSSTGSTNPFAPKVTSPTEGHLEEGILISS